MNGTTTYTWDLGGKPTVADLKRMTAEMERAGLPDGAAVNVYAGDSQRDGAWAIFTVRTPVVQR